MQRVTDDWASSALNSKGNAGRRTCSAPGLYNQYGIVWKPVYKLVYKYLYAEMNCDAEMISY